MKNEKDYLDKIRYLYTIKLNKINLKFEDLEMSFQKSYYKNKEEWEKKLILNK